MGNARRLVIIGLLTTALARSAVASSPDEPKAPEVPIPIFLNAPADRDAFWKTLARPDMVVLDGDLYRKLRQAAGGPGPPLANPSAVVQSVAAAGDVLGDWARLTVEYRVAMGADGPTWVAIHLDGLTLARAVEGSRDLPTRMADNHRWEVELRGKGEHVARVQVLAPVRSTAEGRRVELAIPPAASTQVDLTIPGTVLDASTGVNEPVPVGPAQGEAIARLSARLGPRSKIELAWRERDDFAVKLPALLSAQGEIAVEVERGSIQARSSWVIGAVRGSENQLTVRLDPTETVLDVEVDGRPAQFETHAEAGRSVVTIALAEPLRPGATRSLIFNTRRPIASTGAARVSLQGYSFDRAGTQTGVVAIARNGPIFLNPTPDRGLRRIDPRTELPESLRGRRDTSLAFEFQAQPFELGLSIEPAPPRLRVEGRSTITIDPRSARVQTRLDCRTSQGRVFEVQVLLPRGLDFEGAEPPEVVESTQVIPVQPKGSVGVGNDVPRILSIGLTHQARESGSFAILLKGWCAVDASAAVALPLFRPVADSSTGGRFAVVTDRNVSVELASGTGPPTAFRVDWGSPPEDWAWPLRRPGPELGLLWLRSAEDPETLPLRMTVRPRSIRHESTLMASVDRGGAEVVDEIAGEVAFGAVSRLDLAIPPEVPSRWEVEGVERAGRELLGQDPDGTRRYRLRFARDYADSFRFRVRYRFAIPETTESDRGSRLRLAPIRVLEGTSTGQRVLVSADPGIELKADARGWTTPGSVDPPTSAEGSPPARISLVKADDKAGPVVVEVRPGPRLPMPGLVVSRLWIKTVQRPEDDLATTASFWVESRDGPMTIGLPPGSRWIRARVGSAEVGEGAVEVVAPDEYRLGFPGTTPTGPILVTIDWVVPASSTRDGWPAPRLLGGGVVQQTAWEARLLGTRAGVGTPAGWADENEWSWDGVLWRRRPWKGPAELATWLSGGSTRYRVLDPSEASGPGGNHGYLFSRAGPPVALRFAVFSRVTLLLLCSGPILVAGLLVLARRPPPRVIAAVALLIAFGAGALVESNVLILVLQSSALGVALFLGAMAMHWAIERRGEGRTAGDRPLIVGPSTVGSSMARVSAASPDESTAIRPRPLTPSAVSTADHIVLARPVEPSYPEPDGP